MVCFYESRYPIGTTVFCLAALRQIPVQNRRCFPAGNGGFGIEDITVSAVDDPGGLRPVHRRLCVVRNAGLIREIP